MQIRASLAAQPKSCFGPYLGPDDQLGKLGQIWNSGLPEAEAIVDELLGPNMTMAASDRLSRALTR